MTVDPQPPSTAPSTAGAPTISARAGCRTKFVADPAKYLRRGDDGRQRRAAPGTIYTCPMHPEIRQVGPGSCPICGMALEPELVTARQRPQPRARRHDAALLDRRWR